MVTMDTPAPIPSTMPFPESPPESSPARAPGRSTQRPPACPDLPLRVGVDVGGTKLLLVAEGPLGRFTGTLPTGSTTTPSLLVALIRELLSQARRHCLPEQPELTGAGAAFVSDSHTSIPFSLGLALPGLLDADGTVVASDVLPALDGWQAVADLPELAHGYLGNDGEAALAYQLSQLPLGQQETATVATVGCGTGIAFAASLGGQSLRKLRPTACELGMSPYGPGESFDSVASGAALLRSTGLSAADLQQSLLAALPSPATQALIERAGQAFGAALAAVYHLFQPQQIGLYGGTLQYHGYLPAAMAEFARRTASAHPPNSKSALVCDVQLLPESGLAVALGAMYAASRRSLNAQPSNPVEGNTAPGNTAPGNTATVETNSSAVQVRPAAESSRP